MKSLNAFITILFLLNAVELCAQSPTAEISTETNKKCRCIPGEISKECFKYCKDLQILNESNQELKKKLDKIYEDKLPEETEHNSKKTIKKVKQYLKSEDSTPNDAIKFSTSEKKALEHLLQNNSAD